MTGLQLASFYGDHRCRLGAFVVVLCFISRLITLNLFRLPGSIIWYLQDLIWTGSSPVDIDISYHLLQIRQ